MRVRDFGYTAALLKIVCFAWVSGSSLPLHPPTPHPTLPLSLFHSPSLALPDPYAQNLRLISSSAGQSALCRSLVFFYCACEGGLWHLVSWVSVSEDEGHAALPCILFLSLQWSGQIGQQAQRQGPLWWVALWKFIEGVAPFVPERTFSCSLVWRTLSRHALFFLWHDSRQTSYRWQFII